MQEFHLENVLARYPEIIEPGLIVLNRQLSVRSKRIDLLFIDETGRKLIVEVKIGTLCPTDIGQLSEYCHYVFEKDGVRPRGMLVGAHVPDEIRGAAGFNGFECKCLTLGHLEQLMWERGDREMLDPLRSSSASAAPRVVASSTEPPNQNLWRTRPDRSDERAGVSSEPPHSAHSQTDILDLSIADMLRSVLSQIERGTILKAHEIASGVLDRYPGKTTRASILPPDKCYNITNAGLSASHDFRIFEYLGQATYRYLGEGYPYSGHVTWKGVRCGLWTKGVLAKWDNWPVLRP